ncbi:MAG: hypothetical protein ACI86M_003720 [Saprospiraceae bacterium]|jgi:hypothetical protein
MRVFIFLLIFSIFALSCDKKEPVDGDEISLPACAPVIISDEVFQDLDQNEAMVSEVSIYGDCLYLKMGVSGCDSNHVINMVSDGSIDDSLPLQITFDFQDENPQLCEAYFTLFRQYDLVPIRELVKGDIVIRFRNSELSIFYEY